MWDTKPEVKKAAYTTMEKDIERFIPECIANPENVPETVHLLGATTFVTDVHGDPGHHGAPLGLWSGAARDSNQAQVSRHC